MTPQHRARSRRDDSGDGVPAGPGANRGQEREDEIIGLKREIEVRIRELDLIRPEPGANQVVVGSDLPLQQAARQESRPNAAPLGQAGSTGSLANNQGQNKDQNHGSIVLLLIASFLIGCAFPPFLVVFVLILVGVLVADSAQR